LCGNFSRLQARKVSTNGLLHALVSFEAAVEDADEAVAEVDRVDPVPGRDQRLHPRAALGLDPDDHLRLVHVAEVLADHGVQLRDPGDALGQLGRGQHLAGSKRVLTPGSAGTTSHQRSYRRLPDASMGVRALGSSH
jgi:hypothetical protein